jgi:ribosomal protein L37AE/L43A
MTDFRNEIRRQKVVDGTAKIRAKTHPKDGSAECHFCMKSTNRRTGTHIWWVGDLAYNAVPLVE